VITNYNLSTQFGFFILGKQVDIKNFKSKIKLNPISWAVFLPTIVVVLISLTSVIFPALILRTLGGFDDSVGIDPFEPGSLAIPFLLSNFIILAICVLYYKNKLPQAITKSIRFIFNFEISSNLAFFVIVIIIGTYIAISVGELFNGVFLDDYYIWMVPILENYDIFRIEDAGLDKHFLYFLTESSMQLFGNYKVVPFIASISLLVLTYLFTFEITKKRFAGIVAMVIVLQSTIFLYFDTSVVYPNYWIVFYLLSLYLIYKKWPISPISYVLSMATKGLTALFFPMTLFFIYRSRIVRQKKILLTIFYGIIILFGAGIFILMGQSSVSSLDNFAREFDSHDFWGGFTTISTTLRIDGLVLIFLLPLTFGLFVASRKGVLHADSILFFILIMLLYAPFLAGFTWHQHEPYRFIPMIVFFAIGVGVLLSKRPN